MKKPCILASASPRRKEILERFGVPFDVFVTGADEACPEADPAKLSEAVAAIKGEAALAALAKNGSDLTDRLLIASDTTVFAGGRILGKPCDAEDAAATLRLLSGGAHQVVSGIFLSLNGVNAVSHEITTVWMDELDEETIRAYVASGEPFGKAGSYAIQGPAAAWISRIDGDYLNVVGLPFYRLCRLYRETYGENFL